MTFRDEREVMAVEIVVETNAVRQNLSFRLQISVRSSDSGLPRKVMIVCYFTETKGLVGCHYRSRLAFKVRDLRRLKTSKMLASQL
jgi:hypothetical protein